MSQGTLIRLRRVALLVIVLIIASGAAPNAFAGVAEGWPAPSSLLPGAETPPAATAGGEPSNPYYSVRTITLPDGTQLDEAIVNGPAEPPPGYELEREPVAPSALNRPDASVTLAVPAYNWVFGCGAVAASMIGAYYDRNGFPNIYTGPANGGVMPARNDIWPTWTDSVGKSYPGNPLAASRMGSDGRTTRGSIDDYWVAYESAAQDPYITGGWAQHAWGDSFGDYMKTSQSAYGNPDGSTALFWDSSGARLTCAAMSSGAASRDATFGRKLFYEARGYTVTDCFNQRTDNVVAGGFSFAEYKAQIDAGRPVFLMLTGHFVVGTGYDNSTTPATVYINDTWDYDTHSMPWGGSYSGMQMLAAGIANLSTPATPTPAITGLNPSSATPGGPGFTLTVNGTNFVNGSVVRWNGSNRATTFVNGTRLTAAISAADIATTRTVSVTVLNPAPGGGVSNAVSFVVGTLRKVYMPAALKDPPPAGPQPGYWEDDLRLEFYVTSDRKYVDDFALHITGVCGNYIITHTVPVPISGNTFSFSGPFYGSGTFLSTTAANVMAGLDDFYIPGCGYVSGGPWYSTATWRYATAATDAPATTGVAGSGGAPRDGAGINTVEPATGMPGVEVVRVK